MEKVEFHFVANLARLEDTAESFRVKSFDEETVYLIPSSGKPIEL